MAAESFSMKVITEPVTSAMKDRRRRVDRATMWALRDTGRALRREMAKSAPVVTGNLKRSFHSSKRLKSLGEGMYSVTVGPRGNPRLYAGKVESIHGNVASAFHSVLPTIRERHALAWERAMR